MGKNGLFYAMKTCLIVSGHKSNAKQKKKNRLPNYFAKKCKKVDFFIKKPDFDSIQVGF